MRVGISAPFVDTRADDLVWALGHPLIDPLAVRSLRFGGTGVELRVLGASHQVVVTSAAGVLVETVACLPGVDGALPGSAERSHGTGRYRFDSRVENLTRTGLARRVDDLHREVADDPGGLLVAFPGDPLAVTALHLDPGGAHGDGNPLHWRTWHVYPQSGELVTTHSTVSAHPCGETR
ncbi:DUF2617 family protein [Nocardiopsis changdeensis]|uniref:DUF2617 family protein n=1 Tax=Nocardiopsis changdeensis TaxID=2831969 RepID=A0ABX8BM27_9ACTN|nr:MULTISPECIES: DUF2617 family protein [Nocardiopsis]QUX22117.1 DUF2617 family protein [Nocardiopsis changdeensis]QYX38056.1 DUF2617 family protein [Nocardiopsis sp. MT53]